MNPQEIFCPNLACSARGQVGQGNFVCIDQREGRYRCTTCGQTFRETSGTALYGIKKAHQDFTRMVTLLGHGCPAQAIVAAFELDERTVADWQHRAGEHCRAVHEQAVGQSHLDLGQAQADKIRVKAQRGVVWMALAIMVSTRLWLGGMVSTTVVDSTAGRVGSSGHPGGPVPPHGLCRRWVGRLCRGDSTCVSHVSAHRSTRLSSAAQDCLAECGHCPGYQTTGRRSTER